MLIHDIAGSSFRRRPAGRKKVAGVKAIDELNECTPGRVKRVELLKQRSVLEAAPYLQHIIDALPHITVVINDCRQVITANQPLLEALGVTQVVDVIGQRPGEMLRCIHAFDGPEGCGSGESCKTCGAYQAILGKSSLGVKVSREARITVEKSGREESLDLLVTVAPVSLAGLEQFSIVTITDISDQKRRRALERIFFHDVMNTAGGLKGCLECLNEAGDPAESQELLQDLLSITEVLISEIEEHRDLTAAEARELRIKSVPFMAGDLAQHTLQRFRAHLSARERRLEMAPESQNPELLSDETLVRRLLVNLLKNACEGSGPGETVTLGVQRHGAQVIFSVHNPAVMEESVKAQVFQRSFSTKGADRGLGTYGVKLLAENYLGGQVSFSSEPNQGTTFSVALPAPIAAAGGQ